MLQQHKDSKRGDYLQYVDCHHMVHMVGKNQQAIQQLITLIYIPLGKHLQSHSLMVYQNEAFQELLSFFNCTTLQCFLLV